MARAVTTLGAAASPRRVRGGWRGLSRRWEPRRRRDSPKNAARPAGPNGADAGLAVGAEDALERLEEVVAPFVADGDRPRAQHAAGPAAGDGVVVPEAGPNCRAPAAALLRGISTS